MNIDPKLLNYIHVIDSMFFLHICFLLSFADYYSQLSGKLLRKMTEIFKMRKSSLNFLFPPSLGKGTCHMICGSAEVEPDTTALGPRECKNLWNKQ